MFLFHYFADQLAGGSAAALERAERTRLRSELESYRTEAERNELHEILSRHSDADVAHLEQLTGWRAA